MSEEAELEALERRLRGIVEVAMRREVVLAALSESDAQQSYALIAAVLSRSGRDVTALVTLRRTIQQVLVEGGATQPLDYRLRAHIYAVALGRGDELVMRLLRSPDVAASMADPPAALSRSVADIPLGMRRSLAKGLDKSLLDQLLLDPDPVVVRNLLENGRITEDEVVRLAGRRPMPGSTLAIIHRSRRFSSRPRVRQALAYNPYCPTDIAIEIVGTLALPALRRVARDETLHPEVRSHARTELTRRD